MMRQTGKVILVGAGPGDAGLLTVKGRDALAAADVVVYDRLVGEDILALLPPDAERIDVGKEAGHHPIPQDEINRILLDKALEGRCVVRLKGGDPFLFGRGGEELELLKENNIPFEVVPGVTSAVSVPCYAGIPVTHRDFCSSVHIITGHARQDGQLHIDFDALNRTGGTLVFLMSVSSMGDILRGLMDGGMSPQMPAATVERGTLPGQRKTVATVGTLEETAKKRGVRSPAILIVGRVCALNEEFDWFGALPLSGKTILVTRPRERSGVLTHKLRAMGAKVISYPCIETEIIEDNAPAKKALSDLAEFQWLALTSPAGVTALFRLLEEMRLDARALAPVKLAVIGGGTARVLEEHGLRADYIPETYDAAHLARGLAPLVKAGERVLIPRAEMGTRELTEILEEAGIAYLDVPVYKTHYRNESSVKIAQMLGAGGIDYVTFTSASTVTGFMGSLENPDVSKFVGVCIGISTEREAEKYCIRTITAKNATIPALIDRIIREDNHGDDR